MAVKLHLATCRPNRFGGFTTHTLCGRDNKANLDGCNSTGNPAEVTCKFCLKHPRFAAEAARP